MSVALAGAHLAERESGVRAFTFDRTFLVHRVGGREAIPLPTPFAA